MMEKSELRKKYKKSLDTLNRCTYEQNSYVISKRLKELKEFKEANTIAITLSRFPEVDTWQIIRHLWDIGKQVAVPKCVPQTKEMVFKQITSFTQLESVYFGLYEPIDVASEIKKTDLDLIIVPGLAFTKQGYRLGFGGGYYDRFLLKYEGSKISLAFSEQIKQNLPIEDHDIPVDIIITESNKIICR
ncbi:5-formyltetrahydrofolate cyclo-ligase [Heyndrickxia sp. FSL K6-6286]|uniref:5-formyltetrahydrofolate cyclo-ligase n=1 Tax=Heyndrickxia sp. FSL K6-6286 TaxID=2921510 RepID=UPI00315A139A